MVAMLSRIEASPSPTSFSFPLCRNNMANSREPRRNTLPPRKRMTAAIVFASHLVPNDPGECRVISFQRFERCNRRASACSNQQMAFSARRYIFTGPGRMRSLLGGFRVSEALACWTQRTRLGFETRRRDAYSGEIRDYWATFPMER